MTPNEQTAVEALKLALNRLTELSYRVPDALWNEDWVAIQNTIPEAIALLEDSPTVPVSRNDWDRGFYCAVAQLIKEEGLVTSATRSLYLSGCNPENADSEDKKVFIEHGLMQS